MRYSGLAAQPSPPEELGATHSDPLRGRRSPVLCCAPLFSSDLWLQARASPGPARWRVTLRFLASAHTMQAPFLCPPPPLLLVRLRTGAEGGGNVFSGKQFQALAVCARILLPTNLV